MTITPQGSDILVAAQRGDAAALSQLLSQVQGRIYRFSMKMCRDPHDAEEVLQETLIAMTQNLSDFRGDSAISSWAYAIARSFCVKHRRRSKFAPDHEESLDQEARGEARAVPDPRTGPEELTSSLELRALLDRAIADLDPKYRDVLVLRDVEGLSAPEVAKLTELSVAAVKSRLHRARKSVREGLTPLLRDRLPAPSSSCPDTITLFSQHLEGELDAGACATMEAHLADCASCQGTCDVLRETLAACRTTPEPQVPAQVQEAVRRAVKAFIVSQQA